MRSHYFDSFELCSDDVSPLSPTKLDILKGNRGSPVSFRELKNADCFSHFVMKQAGEIEELGGEEEEEEEEF